MRKTLALILVVAAAGLASASIYVVLNRTEDKEIQSISTSSPTSTLQNPPENIATSSEPIGARNGSTEKVILKSIRLNGVKAFSKASMNALTAQFLGVPIALEDLTDISVTIENFYKRNNFAARVILNQKEITNGILILDVLESQLSNQNINQQLNELANAPVASTAIDSASMNTSISEPLTPSESAISYPSVSAPEIDQSSSRRTISDDKVETDLILKLYKDHSRQSELVIDNSGEKRWGNERVEAKLSLVNAWNPSDELTLSALISKGSEFFKSKYNFAIGSSGWNLGLSATAMDYKVIWGDNAVLGDVGKAFSQTMDLNYPISRAINAQSDLRLAAQTSQFTNVSSAGHSLSEYDTEVLMAAFSGVDKHFMNSSRKLTYDFQWRSGQVHVKEAAQSQFADQGGTSTAGQFNLMRVNLTYIEPWMPTTDVYVGLTTQLADKNLSYAEKIQMGGALGIRAYPTGAGMATNGQMINVELRHQLENGLLLTGFYDWGHITEMINPDPSSPANLPNNHVLKGYGLSARYNFSQGASVKATWAKRDGEDPRPGDSRIDHPTDRNRFWLQLTIPF